LTKITAENLPPVLELLLFANGFHERSEIRETGAKKKRLAAQSLQQHPAVAAGL